MGHMLEARQRGMRSHAALLLPLLVLQGLLLAIWLPLTAADQLGQANDLAPHRPSADSGAIASDEILDLKKNDQIIKDTKAANLKVQQKTNATNNEMKAKAEARRKQTTNETVSSNIKAEVETDIVESRRVTVRKNEAAVKAKKEKDMRALLKVTAKAECARLKKIHTLDIKKCNYSNCNYTVAITKACGAPPDDSPATELLGSSGEIVEEPSIAVEPNSDWGREEESTEAGTLDA